MGEHAAVRTDRSFRADMIITFGWAALVGAPLALCAFWAGLR